MSSTLTIYNLSVRIDTNDQRLINTINSFLASKYTHIQKGFTSAVPDTYKIYVSATSVPGTFYMHKNQYKEFVDYAGGVFTTTEIINKEDYVVDYVPMEIREGWAPREHQVPIIDFLLDNPTMSKMVPLETGGGKGFISLTTIAKLSVRTGIIILPTYIEKWAKEIVQIHKTTANKIMVIQGQKSIRALVEVARSGSLDSDYIIFSSKTMQDFISAYENNPVMTLEEYGIEPIDLMPLLGIGVVIIDETHQHFHAMYKNILHCNVKYQIGLSATLLSDDYMIRKMHNIMYPKSCIYKTDPTSMYTDVYAINYTIRPDSLKKIQTNNYKSQAYSHIAFEKSILRRQWLYANYISIIHETIENYFLEDYMKGDKLLIYVSTIDLATKLSEDITNRYKQFSVNRYCENDPYDNLHTSDIIVSTIISAGTAVDIKNLRVVIQTIAISSSVANIQSLGRLRKLSDRDTKFCYLYSNNISKHNTYHRKRKELFANRVKRTFSRNARRQL